MFTGILCPKCGGDTKTYGTQLNKSGERVQRYKCKNCSHHFTKLKHICKYCGDEISYGQEYGRHVLNCKRKHTNHSIDLTEKQKQLIYGSMLGDMYMSYASKKDSKLPLIEVTHGIEQRAYVMWKYDILKNIVKNEPKESKIYSKRYDKWYDRIRFYTMSLASLIPMYDITHREGKRYISREWLSNINNPISITAWYLDDGNYYHGCRANTVFFSLGNVTEEEASSVDDFMRDALGINGNIRTDSWQTKYFIGKKEEISKLMDIVAPIILNEISSMKYKLHYLLR
jgi:hypothetical protein